MIPRLRLAVLAGFVFLGCAAQAQLKPPAAGAAAPAAAAAANSDVKSDPEKENAGKLAALGWLTLLDRKDWGTAWEQSSTAFRQTVPLANWMDGIPKVRDPLGTLMVRQPQETIYKTSLPGRPAGHYVHTSFISKFENQAVQEVVTAVLDADGKWRVMGYSYKVAE